MISCKHLMIETSLRTSIRTSSWMSLMSTRASANVITQLAGPVATPPIWWPTAAFLATTTIARLAASGSSNGAHAEYAGNGGTLMPWWHPKRPQIQLSDGQWHLGESNIPALHWKISLGKWSCASLGRKEIIGAIIMDWGSERVEAKVKSK